MRQRARVGMAVAGLAFVGVSTLAVVVTLREPQGRFLVERGSIVDRRTGLIWQREVGRERLTWAEADRRCRRLRIEGAPARLPTRDELRGLVDERRLPPLIDPSFAGTEPGWYWSSTPFPRTTRFVWGVSFEYGGLHYLLRESRRPARCVGTRRSPGPTRPEERSSPVQRPAGLGLQGIVRRAEVEGDRITLAVGRADGAPLPPTRAGQTVLLGLPLSHRRTRLARDAAFFTEPGSLVRRRYTVTSPPSERGALEVTVKLRPDGVLSPRLLTLRRGDRVWLGARYGDTSLRELFGDEDVVLIGSGVGIAHFVAYLRGDLACDGPRRVLLLHGATRSEDLWFRGELEALARRCRSFTYVPTLLRPQDERVAWTGATGTIEDLWAGGVVERAWGRRPEPGTVHVSMCATLSLVDHLLALLGGAGYREPRDGRPGDLSFCEVD